MSQLELIRPPLVFGAILAASLLFRCSDKSGGGAAVSGSCPPGVCGGAGAGGQSQSGGTGGVVPVATDGKHWVKSCTDATVKDDCPLPASTCAADSNAMIYFTSPTCDNGLCRWPSVQIPCPAFGACIGGACINTAGTLGPIPNFDSGGAGNGGGGVTGNGGAPNGGGGTLGSSGAGGALGSGGAGGTMESPTYLCADAGVAQDCPAPPPVCADTSTLATFDHPSCSFGTCSWLRHTVPCQDTCQAGHCTAGHANDNACFTGGDCALPPSQCLDGTKMLYFSNPRCADEGSGMRCVLEGRVTDCYNRGCMNGGCLPGRTLAL